MKQPCGCCAGLEVVTPELEANRPGLSALVYRAGTYATFLESMLARISTIYLDVPTPDGSGKLQRIFPLNGLVLNGGKFERVSAGLSTRELNDPSIALLDAWATVADVLTFYEERIANEGYLRTATERRSVLELARLVGYRLRPGISSSVYLAFTVSDGFNGIIPSGTRAQSIPGTGEKPQPFETYVDLPARDVWNNLKPRLTRPQVITMPGQNPDGTPLAIPLGTGADIVETIYSQGISTNLNPGDHLLIVLGDGDKQQFLRKIHAVDVQAGDKRTEVTLDVPPPQVQPNTQVAALTALKNDLQTFINEAAQAFADTDLATEVAKNILQPLYDKIDPNATGATEAIDMIRAILPGLTEKYDLALKRKFTRLKPWIANILDTLNTVTRDLTVFSPSSHLAIVTTRTGQPFKGEVVSSPLESLTAIVGQLAKPPSVQPANSERLTRSVSAAFSPQSDIAPRMLATFFPTAAEKLYTAWGGVETPAIQVEVYALRVKAGLFPGTYPGPPTITQAPDPNHAHNLVTTTSYDNPPRINTAWSDLPHALSTGVPTIALEAVYDKILVGSWVAVDRPVLDANLKVTNHKMTFHKVIRVQTLSRATSAYVTRITQLTLDPPWLTDLTGTTGQLQLRNDLTSPDFLRGTVVYAQSEKLDLTDEPLDTDVEKRTVELDGLYDGLESGRWIIVSGERTDIPNVSGVTASELVMISSVVQGSRAPLCAVFPAGIIPFSSVSYTTAANAAGDKLVVGILAVDVPTLQGVFPNPPSPANQQFCDQVQLGPGVYASAYVPTPAELSGDFSDFEGLLIDPANSQPYPGGQITINKPPTAKPQVFAWRISTAPVHTILNLANDLAYKYDSTNVTIYGNVVKATHGQTQGEVLGDGNASRALQKFPLHQFPLTYLPAPTPSGADSTLVVRVNEIKWQEADNLFVLGPSDRGYITRTDDSDKTTATTGNGEHGLRVPTGTANVKAVYRSGTGRPGNVNAQQISQMATQPLGVRGVINPLRAAGGADGDTRDQARRNIPIGITALDRLVSVPDYADFARKFAGIGKASARRLTDGRRLLVHLTITGKDDIPIDPTTDLYQALVQALAQAGDPHQPVQIALRRLRVLVITAGVKVQPAYTWESVVANLRSTLLDLYSFDRRELGQSAFLSEAVSAMQAVAGVRYVGMQKFDSVSESVTAAQLASLASTLGLDSFVEAELAHVEPTEVDPAKRIKPAELVILTPDIPDTLILTEITT